eukprot:2155745-Amphidinium_carterae.1
MRNYAWSDCGRFSRLELVAARDIAPGEQLSIDYGWYDDEEVIEAVQSEALNMYRKDVPLLRQMAGRLGHVDE